LSHERERIELKAYKGADVKKFDKRPGLVGTIVHGEGQTLAYWTFEEGVELVPHSHVHAQITCVVSGKIRFDTASGSETAGPGDFVVFAPNEAHGGFCLEKAVALDAFVPAREDFKSEMGWTD
jgi:quercetin dioxygenase-like cupin family protein